MQLFFKTIHYCFYCSFHCFLKLLAGEKSFWGRPLPPSSRKPEVPFRRRRCRRVSDHYEIFENVSLA